MATQESLSHSSVPTVDRLSLASFMTSVFRNVCLTPALLPAGFVLRTPYPGGRRLWVAEFQLCHLLRDALFPHLLNRDQNPCPVFLAGRFQWKGLLGHLLGSLPSGQVYACPPENGARAGRSLGCVWDTLAHKVYLGQDARENGHTQRMLETFRWKPPFLYGHFY